MVNWEEIQNEWESSKITVVALAEKYDLKLGTIKSRKSRDGWSRDPSEKDATKKKKVATVKKDATPKEVFVESEGLTDKQRLFCIYYIKSFNQTMAAIKAGYSPDRAHVTGSELVRNRKVADEIRRLKGEMRQDIFIDAMDILEKYIKIAFADISDYVEFGSEDVVARDEDGMEIINDDGEKVTFVRSFLHFKNAEEIDGSLVSEISNGRNGPVVKLADKMKALEMLSKYFDLLSENEKKKLQEEKLKVDIAKGNAEIEKLNDNDDEGPIEIMISRKGGR